MEPDSVAGMNPPSLAVELLPAPPNLDTLPPELLLEIFSGGPDLELTRIDICKRLLPFARRALYSNVNTYSLARFVQLQDTIARYPEDGELVSVLCVSYFEEFSSRKDDAADSDEEWSDTSASSSDSAAGGSGSNSDAVGEAAKSLAALLLDPASGSRVSTATPNPLDPERLASFLSALPNLTDFAAFGKQLAYGLLIHSDPPGTTPSKLESLSVHIRSDEFFDHFDDSNFFVLARRYPLQSLEIVHANAVPIDEAEYEDEDDPDDWPMRPRSWNLKRLELRRLAHLSAGSQYLFQAFSCLEYLFVSAAVADTDFSTYITHLPSTLVNLFLRIGQVHPTPLERSTAPTLAPFRPNAFPNLRALDLGGTIVTRELLASLHHLPRLECLHLSHGASLFLSSLLALFQSGPDRLTSLVHLQIHVCHCPAGARDGLGLDTRTRRVPNWQPHAGFGRTEAKTLVRAGSSTFTKDGRRFRIDGAILCALQICGRGEESHACERDGDDDEDD